MSSYPPTQVKQNANGWNGQLARCGGATSRSESRFFQLAPLHPWKSGAGTAMAARRSSPFKLSLSQHCAAKPPPRIFLLSATNGGEEQGEVASSQFAISIEP
jgi:hypothetical protein